MGSLGRHIWKGRRRVWLAWAVGIGIGAALGRSDRLDRWFWPWLNTFLNLPALVIIVICYLGLGMSELAAVLAVVINKAPLIATNVRDGVRQFETRYDEFASIYRLSWTQKVRLIWLPQLEPFLFTALRTGLSLTARLSWWSSYWPFFRYRVQIHLYFQLFEVDMILAYALSFMIAMQLIDLVVVRPLENRVQKWRKDGQLA